jgi:hypothetical protein
MHFHFKTKYLDDTGMVQLGHYGDGSIAMRLITTFGEPLAMPTVCLAAYYEKPAEGNVFIRSDYSENAGIYGCLNDLGIVGPVIRIIPLAYDTHAFECKLLIDEEKAQKL